MDVNRPLSLNQASEFNAQGLKYFAIWELDRAIMAFKEATTAEPNNPEYHLNLARAYARNGSYPEAMRSLGDYLHVETDEDLSDRYERLFSSALDQVESHLLDGMRVMDHSVPLAGRAIQMWLEYRLTIGRRQLRVDNPEAWAAALIYVVCRLNFIEVRRDMVAAVFRVDPLLVRQNSDELVEALDLIPADYRYFIGDSNPLDKVFEAAKQLDALNRGIDK